MACVYLVPLVSQVSPLQGLADGSTRHRAGASLGKAVAAVKPPPGRRCSSCAAGGGTFEAGTAYVTFEAGVWPRQPCVCPCCWGRCKFSPVFLPAGAGGGFGFVLLKTSVVEKLAGELKLLTCPGKGLNVTEVATRFHLTAT